MQVFETESEFIAAVRSQMSADVPAEVLGALETGIATGERDGRAAAGEAEGLNLRIGNWVLRDQDLPILEAVGSVGSGLVAIAATGPLGVAAAVSGLSNFAKLVWDAWRKSARLSNNEIALLGLLEVQGPKTEEDLIAEAVKLKPEETADEFRRCILSLTDVELGNGDVVELIRRDASDRWRTR